MRSSLNPSTPLVPLLADTSDAAPTTHAPPVPLLAWKHKSLDRMSSVPEAYPDTRHSGERTPGQSPRPPVQTAEAVGWCCYATGADDR
ncbi:hypothetical protein [Haloquadratum walsbyi]|uniref:hypothetical protein n=1 Tax=Haloquadratum walsbyi TaxID=293091 RepID=UPI0026EFA4F7|nr:hypothetical protein [Haloquadratum walsbyi]